MLKGETPPGYRGSTNQNINLQSISQKNDTNYKIHVVCCHQRLFYSINSVEENVNPNTNFHTMRSFLMKSLLLNHIKHILLILTSCGPASLQPISAVLSPNANDFQGFWECPRTKSAKCGPKGS